MNVNAAMQPTRRRRTIQMRTTAHIAATAVALLCFSAPPAEGQETPDQTLPERPTDVHPILVGTRVPEGMLEVPGGSALDLRRTAAEKPAVLVFYRGGW